MSRSHARGGNAGQFQLFDVSKLCEPILQDLLLRRLNFDEPNSHSCGSRIGDLPQSRECGASVSNPYSNLCSVRQRNLRLDEAAEDAQVTRACRNLPFRIDIHHFDSGHKWVAHSAMLFHLHDQSKYGPVFCPHAPSWRRSVPFFTYLPWSTPYRGVLSRNWN
jgi:hypothetical protein